MNPELRPDYAGGSIVNLAASIATALDAPATGYAPLRGLAPAELARRRKAGLTPNQDAHLTRWGYPYVFDEYRFHITLTDSLSMHLLQRVQPRLERLFGDALTESLPVEEIHLLKQPTPASRFHVLESFPLAGHIRQEANACA